MAQSFPDSLLETQTQTLEEVDDDRQQHQLQEPPPQSQSADKEDKVSPSLSRNGSSSRLNAKAPEFVPRTTDSIPSPRLVAPPSPQPQPIHHHHHVYPPNPPFHHVPVPVPVQNPHHHHPYPPPPPPPHHHHHVLPPPPALHFHNPHPHHPHHHLNHSHHNNNHQHHHRHSHAGGSGSASAVDHQQQQHDQAPAGAGAGDLDHPVSSSKNGLTDEATQKILNQVEYYFSDVNLATTDHLIRFINKDPEGFVPISVVASFKKIKALISSNSQLAGILRNSGKLIVSEDGKKVRRQQPLTDPDMEDLQSRIIIAENLPEDHCHQNLMKIFSAVGSVKTIRTCQPQASNGGASSASRTGKADHALFSNKLHAFVEYESIELAEKAVAELNDEGTWRNGLRVRLLLKRQAKPAQGRSKKAGQENETHNKEDDASVKPAQAKHAQGRSKKAGQESEVRHKEDDTSTSEQNETNEKHIDPAQQSDAQSHEHPGEEHPNSNEKEGGHKKGRNRRGKGRGRSHYNHNNSRGNHAGNPNGSANPEHPGVGKHQPPGPRMPDGTRGFSMGRGKPISATNHV